MRLRGLHTSGYLDISSQETLQGELVVFRRALLPGQIIEVPDELRGLLNIDTAVTAGLLEVIEYDDADGSIVVNAELEDVSGTASSTITIGSGETKTLDSVDVSVVRTAKWFISVEDGTNGTYLATEIYAIHDDSDAEWSEHVELGSASVTFAVDIVGGAMRLRVSATDNNQVVKAERISVPV